MDHLSQISAPFCTVFRFGSNVKVLKTSGITPMPNYEGMTDDELKVRDYVLFIALPFGETERRTVIKRDHGLVVWCFRRLLQQ